MKGKYTKKKKIRKCSACGGSGYLKTKQGQKMTCSICGGSGKFTVIVIVPDEKEDESS